MKSLLDKDIVQNISESILKSQLAFTKKSNKLVDVPSLFRIIKKKLDFTPVMSFLKDKEEDIEKEINYEDFKSFVKDVNPYFKIDKSDKKAALKNFENLSSSKNQSQIFIETPYRNNKLLEDLLQILQANTHLCIATDITLPTEFIKTFRVADWKKIKVDLHNRPTIFIIHKT